MESRGYFGGLLGGDTWRAWRVLLIAIAGEELTPSERAVFRALTNREREPGEPVEEFWGVIGRRGGKTRAMAVLGAFVAACVDHRHVLAPGERGVLPILAVSTAQAATAFNFISGVFATAQNLKGLIDSRTVDTLRLASGVDIEVRPASFRTIRGVTAVAAICDEIAFWRSEDSANPDKEILKALRPSLATTGGLLACISSPHAKRGELYETFKRHFGQDGHRAILVANAPSRTMNPSLSRRVVDRAYDEDPDLRRRSTAPGFVPTSSSSCHGRRLKRALPRTLRWRSPLSGVRYSGFCDPSGGTSDAMAMAVAHQDGNVSCSMPRRAQASIQSRRHLVVSSLKTFQVVRHLQNLR